MSAFSFYDEGNVRPSFTIVARTLRAAVEYGVKHALIDGICHPGMIVVSEAFVVNAEVDHGR